MNRKKLTDFEKDLKKQLKDKKFKEYFDMYGKQFETEYKVIQLRKHKNTYL